MAKTDFMNNLTRTVNKVGFQIKKHSPEILITAGIVGTVTSAVMACKATLKVNEVLEDAQKQISDIKDATAKVEAGIIPKEKYSPEDAKKDLTIIYAQTGLKFVKLYGPAVALGALSIYGIVKSHSILNTRNAALAAAYATVDKGFKEYRGRVVERFGKELDHELRYNIKAKEIETQVVDEETGEIKTVKEVVQVAEIHEPSDYARFFDESCPNWTKDANYNLIFLKAQQAQANKVLQTKGYLFLNEVYEMLGMQKTAQGQVVGWLYNPNDPDWDGDNFVDFGIYDQYGNVKQDERKRAFVNGYERSILLDFNVDGTVYDLVRWRDGL